MNNNATQLAPIVLFVYNRVNNTKQTIEAMQNNTLAIESNLYIYSDAAKNSNANQSVSQVRKYIKSLSGFKTITIIERESNFGLAKSIIEGVSEVIKVHNKVIVLEDDLLTSRNFITYMNQALDFYKEDKNIFSISGYTGKLASLSNLKDDVYLSYRPSSWGWATWKDQWDGIDWDVTDFDKFIKNKKEVKQFNRGGIDMTRMLKHCMEGKNHSWAIRWSYAMFKQDKYCIYPKVSKIQNIGFGEGATNCSGVNIYRTDLDTSLECEFNFTDEIVPKHELIKEFKYQYSYINKLIKKTVEIFKGLKKNV